MSALPQMVRLRSSPPARWVSLAIVLSFAITSLAAREYLRRSAPDRERMPAWSCGEGALLSVAEEVDKAGAARLDAILRESPGTLQGARSMLDLAQAARRAGVAATGVRMRDGSDCPAPCVAHLSDGHFVALLSGTSTEVTIFDDGVRRRMPREQFTRLFSGVALVLGERAARTNFGDSP